MMILVTDESYGYSIIFPLSFIVLLISGVKNHLVFCLLSLLLSTHHWLIPALSELRILSVNDLCWRSYLFLPPVLFSLPSFHVLLISGLVFLCTAVTLKIPSTTSWEFPPFCVFIPYFLEDGNIFFFLDFSLFWWSSFSSSFLRKGTYVEVHFFQNLHVWKCLSSAPILYWYLE